MKTKNTFKVYTRKLAIELRNRGFQLVGVEPNWEKPTFDVYCFENTPAIQQAVKEITRK